MVRRSRQKGLERHAGGGCTAKNRTGAVIGSPDGNVRTGSRSHPELGADDVCDTVLRGPRLGRGMQDRQGQEHDAQQRKPRGVPPAVPSAKRSGVATS